MKRSSDIFKLASESVKDLAVLSCADRPRGDEDKGFEGVAEIRVGKRMIRKPYVVRSTVGPDTVQLLSLLRRGSADGLFLVASHVNDRTAELLRSADVQFVDTDGNVFLTGDGMYIWVTGRRTRRAAAGSGVVSTDRAFHPGGLHLLFHLLTDTALDSGKPGAALVDKTYREISAATGIAHSTVGWVMADLMRQNFVIQVSPGQRMFADRLRLLERWVQAYIARMRPGLVVERYQPARADWWQDAELADGLWSGETAAALLTQSLKPQTFTVFGGRPSHDFVLRHSLQKDADGTVEFLKPFWRMPQARAGGSPCVHPLLVYADLLSIDDDRTREVTQIIYDRYLHTLIETA
ncbi:MAG: hypothetical protein EOM72_10730 [Opitutae bacterium]|nr:hypothetical protein [Opitutae bacterium]